MQCLYCETELKPFRGLFDEDFCCRDHREKYFSSFRKALNRLPVLETPAAPETAEPVAPQIVIDIVTDAETRLVREAATEGVVALASAVAGNAPEQHSRDPRAAGFQKTQVTPGEGDESFRTAPQFAFGACGALALPQTAAMMEAAIAAEERPAMLLEPLEMALSISNACAPVDFAPVSLAQAGPEAGPAALEAAEIAPFKNDGLAAAGTQEAGSAQPLVEPRAGLMMPVFRAAADPAAGLLPSAEAVELSLQCRQLVSSPVASAEFALAFPLWAPVFTASREAMGLNAPIAVIQPDPDVAPAAVLSAAPADRPVSSPSMSPQMLPPALALHSQQTGAPAQPAGFSSTLPSVPPVAHGDAANQAAEPHTHAPMRVAFGNLVKIKNWRLKITFAKPA